MQHSPYYTIWWKPCNRVPVCKNACLFSSQTFLRDISANQHQAGYLHFTITFIFQQIFAVLHPENNMRQMYYLPILLFILSKCALRGKLFECFSLSTVNSFASSTNLRFKTNDSSSKWISLCHMQGTDLSTSDSNKLLDFHGNRYNLLLFVWKLSFLLSK